MKKIGNGRPARVFELRDNVMVSSEFRIIDLQRNSVAVLKDDIEYLITSEFNIPDYCLDGEIFVIFMLLSNGALYPIQYPGKTESDVLFKIPIAESVKQRFFQTPKYASYFQELEQIKAEIQRNIKSIEEAIPVVQCITEKPSKPTKQVYVIKNKQKRRKNK